MIRWLYINRIEAYFKTWEHSKKGEGREADQLKKKTGLLRFENRTLSGLWKQIFYEDGLHG